jgi:diguanylate cyclase (GGDEF)-like protein
LKRTLADLFFTRERRQRIRIGQAWLACLLMCACVLALHLGAALGVVDRGPLWWWSGASVAGMFVLLAVIRSGANKTMRDPAMTMPQMLYAILCAAWAYTFAGVVHSMVAMILALVLMFGMFGLTIPQIAWIGAYALATFGGAMGLMAQRDPLRYPWRNELVQFVILAVMVIGVGVLTMRLHRMRDRLRRQKLELEAALSHIHRLATHDELTGLVNRRQMQELMEAESRRSERTHAAWCVALLDLDHFKSVNDKHGHAVGDEVLRALSRHANALVRRTDVLARWGGEEFVLLLPNTSLAMAAISLERVRERFHAAPLVIQGIELKVSFSAGLTESIPGETVAQTLERADKLCYRAKTLGRNRVERG